MLSALLAYAADDPATRPCAPSGGRAFVSQSAEAVRRRGARAGGPAHARCSSSPATTATRAISPPTSHLARAAARPLLPEPRRHVRVASRAAAAPRRPARRGARRAARRGRGGAGARRPGRRRLRRRAVGEGPRPETAPARLRAQKGDLLDLDECAADLVAAGYERVEQVEDRGQFAIRGGLLDLFPATEDHAIRVDLFDVEIESLRWFSTFTQRSLGDVEEVEVAPAAELAAEHRELAEVGGDRRRRRRTPRRRRAAARRRLPRDARPRARRGRAGRRRGGDRARR